APRDKRLQAVESALGVRQIVWGQLSGEHGRYLLHFGLRMPSGGIELGSLVGGDVVRLAVQAAQRIRQWLTPEATATVAGLDLGDEFLNEMFARAMQKVRVNRLVEAANLLDALEMAEVAHPELMYESAAIQVRLGRRNATAAIEALERSAHEHASLALQARCHSLRALHLDQQGRTADAIDATHKAIALSDASGLEDLAVHSIVECALRMGQHLDAGAEAMLSQAMPRAERLGSRVLLSKAYWTAGRLAGMRDDWTGAIRHYERALAIARTMDEAAWAPALNGLGWSQLQLGQLEQAHGYARASFHSALISREQPQLGLSAICLLGTSWVTWRIRELVSLFARLQGLSDDQSAMMIVAREVNCRSTFLRMTGHYDRALACIAAAAEQVRESVLLRGICDIERIRVLLRAGRFDEMRQACEALKSHPSPWDRRLLPWIDRVIAFHDYFTPGGETRGLDRLHDIVRSTPACESHARISLDLAWLHLERHEVVPAERLLVPLAHWLEQSVSGILVRARLCYERGDWSQAVALQRIVMSRYAEGVTEVERTLLNLYEATARDGIVRKIPVQRYPLNMYLGIGEGLLPEVPACLGGLGPDTTGN
ncbi:MAG TPA: tetratricopeptide repeat protein, partial [Burkholderiaceae bacterium]